MLIVPLRGDRISVAGLADEQVINSYSSLKEGGAVYIKQPLDPKQPFITLSMIEAINSVSVEQKSNGLFSPKGLIKRKLNIPQIGDTITVLVSKDAQGIEEHRSYIVSDIRLLNKPSKPLEVVCDGTKFTLADIVLIKRKLGFEKFELNAFRALYLDYLPVGSKQSLKIST